MLILLIVPQDPLASLKIYDPQAIAQYYRWRIWQVVLRALTILIRFLSFGLALKVDEWQGKTEKNLTLRASQLRHLLVDLGPTYIKVGQALSTRPDLIRRDYLEELTALQDQLPGVSAAEAYAKIERELGQPVHKFYAQFSPEPVAAASLGQVHKAQLHTGEWVAVKIQRPNLVKQLSLDLYLIRWLSGWIGPYLPLNLGRSLTHIVDEFGTKLFEEIDYLNEGRNCERFAAYFRDDPDVYVPKIYWAYCSKQVLTLEWIDGIKLTNVEGIRAANLDIASLVRIGVVSSLKQLLEYGFFHADPHPGNLFALRNGKMAFIDFGMTDQISQEMKENLVDALVHLVDRDYRALLTDFIRLDFLIPEVEPETIIPPLKIVLDNIVLREVGNFNFKTATDQFSDLMYQYPFQVPSNFGLVIRSVVTLEGVALSLDPKFKLVAIAYPYVAKRLLTDESPGLRQRLTQVLIKDGKFYWNRLENLIEIAKLDGDLDLVPTAQMGLQYLASEEALYLRRQLVLALTEDDHLQIHHLQRLWQLVQPEITSDRIWTFVVELLKQSFPLPIESVASSFLPWSSSETSS